MKRALTLPLFSRWQGGNLEILHRISWRLLSGVLLAALFISPAYAKSKVVTDDALISKYVSREAAPATADQKAKDAAAKKELDKKYALLDPSADDEKEAGKVENMTGAVNAHSNFGLAVGLPFNPETGAEQEAWFNFTSKTKLNGYSNFKAIQDGDTVTVIFKQTVSGKRILKGITFVSKKPAETPAVEEPAPGESAVKEGES